MIYRHTSKTKCYKFAQENNNETFGQILENFL